MQTDFAGKSLDEHQVLVDGQGRRAICLTEFTINGFLILSIIAVRVHIFRKFALAQDLPLDLPRNCFDNDSILMYSDLVDRWR